MDVGTNVSRHAGFFIQADLFQNVRVEIFISVFFALGKLAHMFAHTHTHTHTHQHEDDDEDECDEREAHVVPEGRVDLVVEQLVPSVQHVQVAATEGSTSRFIA